jgi:transposase
MIGLPAGTRNWIAAGVTDLRRGFTGLSGMVQNALQENPFSGHVFVFRGRRGDLIKLLWWSGDGLCLFAKRLERGRFFWPQAIGPRWRECRGDLQPDRNSEVEWDRS